MVAFPNLRRRRQPPAVRYKDEFGRFTSDVERAKRVADIKIAARRAMNMEDRKDWDKRLKWGRQTDGWWFMPRGPYYWIRRGKQPEDHYGYHYDPKSPFPKVNVGRRNTIWATSPDAVPDDIWNAAHLYSRTDDASDRRETRRGEGLPTYGERRQAARRKQTMAKRGQRRHR